LVALATFDACCTQAEMLVARAKSGPLGTASAPVIVPPEPAADDIRWFNGRRIYLEACASCHGADGQPVADAVKYDAEGYPVPPRSFVNGIFKGGSEGHQLYVRILKGLKGTPMPASEGNYSNDDIWDLIHYTQSLAGRSTGPAQLPKTFVPRVTAPADPRDRLGHRPDRCTLPDAAVVDGTPRRRFGCASASDGTG
jgi:mono/diheme cytochrome c family protein